MWFLHRSMSRIFCPSIEGHVCMHLFLLPVNVLFHLHNCGWLYSSFATGECVRICMRVCASVWDRFSDQHFSSIIALIFCCYLSYKSVFVAHFLRLFYPIFMCVRHIHNIFIHIFFGIGINGTHLTEQNVAYVGYKTGVGRKVVFFKGNQIVSEVVHMSWRLVCVCARAYFSDGGADNEQKWNPK